MTTIERVKSVVALLCLGALTTACQPVGEVTEDGVNLTPPMPLLTARNVDSSALRPRVFLNDGQTFDMQRQADGSFSGRLSIPVNTPFILTVEWYEPFQNIQLQLARITQNVIIESTAGKTVNLDWDDYSFQIDSDGDSFTNLQERNAGSDPTQIESTPLSVANPDPDPSTPQPPQPDPDPDPDPIPQPDNATVIIPFINSGGAPQIDGDGVRLLAPDGSLVGEWRQAVQFDLFNQPLGINKLMLDLVGDRVNGTPHRRWAAMHDGKYLYILVLAEDRGIRFFDSERTWEDDSVELFIDGNNSQFDNWGDSDDDDFQYIIPIANRDGSANTSANGRVLIGGGQASLGDGLLYATGPGIGPDGIELARWEQDVYELRIELSKANIVVDEVFGLELQINDDDDGGTRDAKWGWDQEGDDLTWQNPSLMGRVKLAAEPSQ